MNKKEKLEIEKRLKKILEIEIAKAKKNGTYNSRKDWTKEQWEEHKQSCDNFERLLKKAGMEFV